jgi:hypothetical protein
MVPASLTGVPDRLRDGLGNELRDELRDRLRDRFNWLELRLRYEI